MLPIGRKVFRIQILWQGLHVHDGSDHHILHIISLVPCFYFPILEILIKEGGERKSAWIDDDICVDVNELLEMERVTRRNEHRIDERQSIFVRFGLWKHINIVGFGYASDQLRLGEKDRSDIELGFVQRQNSHSKAQFVRNHLDG